MTSLRLRDVAKRYGPTLAVAGMDLDVAPGSRTAIVGPSGSGKTTLLRLIAGFETPDAGRIMLGGTLLADGPETLPAHKRGIGIVAQEGALFPHLSVADNIGFGLSPEENRSVRIAELMDLVQLALPMAEKRPHQLSGGQQQRVALARALARRPKLMLLDEPFSALDTGLRSEMRRMTAEVLRSAEMPVILVTHDQAEALSFADQVAVLRDGRLAQIGAPRELYARPADPWTAVFLGEAILLSGTVRDGFVECPLGRVAADVDARSGRVDIMLRPEQVRLQPLASMADLVAEQPICCGKIFDVEFEGGHCTVTVDLDGKGRPANGTELLAPDASALRLKTASVDIPPVGAVVRLDVSGRAHVF